MLKPGFFTNDDLAELPMAARLLFAGLWTIADRAGRLEDRPRRIKAEILPYDEEDVDGLLTALCARGFLIRYSAEESRYIQIVNFAKHQSPHVREPESVIPAPDEHDASTVQAPDEHDASTSSRVHSPIPDTESHSRIPIPENTETSPNGLADESPAALSERQLKHRSMFGALAQSFGQPTPGQEKARYETAAKSLVSAGCDPSEIPRLHEAWGWINPGPPRVNSLAGQLTILRNATPAQRSNGLTAQEKTQNAIGRYAERIRRNGTTENDERSPTVRAQLADRSVPLDDG